MLLKPGINPGKTKDMTTVKDPDQNLLVRPNIAYADWTTEDVWNTGFVSTYNANLVFLSVQNHKREEALYDGDQEGFYPFTPPPTNQSVFHRWTVGPTYYSTLVAADALGPSNITRVMDLGANDGSDYTPAHAFYEIGNPVRVGIMNYLTDPNRARDLQLYSTHQQRTNQPQIFSAIFGSNGRPVDNVDITTIQCDTANNVCTIPVPTLHSRAQHRCEDNACDYSADEQVEYGDYRPGGVGGATGAASWGVKTVKKSRKRQSRKTTNSRFVVKATPMVGKPSTSTATTPVEEATPKPQTSKKQTIALNATVTKINWAGANGVEYVDGNGGIQTADATTVIFSGGPWGSPPILVGADYQDDAALIQRRADIIHSAAVLLENCQLMKYERATGRFQSLELGRIASHHYVTYISTMVYNQHLRPTMGMLELFRAFALGNGFKLLPVSGVRRLHPSRHVRTPLRRGWAVPAKAALDLCKMVQKCMWGSMTPLRQFKGVPADVMRKAEGKQLPWFRYFDLEAAGIPELIGIPNAGRLVHRLVHNFPKLQLQAQGKIHGGAETFHILVEDVDGEVVLFHDSFVLRQKYEEDEHTHLILPEKFPPPIPLLDLQALPLSALHNKEFEEIYASTIETFSKIQTQVFQALYTSDENVFIGAPTGSGETICAKFVLLRLCSKRDAPRAVCIEPYQEMVDQRVAEWRAKFAMRTCKVGKRSRWRQRKNVQKIGLLIADEVQLVGGEVGPTYEVISYSTKIKTCIVACGVSLANARDLAEWMGAPLHAIFNFSPRYLHHIRDPGLVETLKHGIGYFHETLDKQDERIVQRLFDSGAIQVLVASKFYEGKEYRGNNPWPLTLMTHLYTHVRDLSPAKFNLTLHTNTPLTPISPSTRARLWTLATPRGPVYCTFVLHTPNAYASALLPHLHGTPGKGIVPTPGQVLATHAAVPSRVPTTASWGNNGPEYGPLAAATSSSPPLQLGWDGLDRMGWAWMVWDGMDGTFAVLQEVEVEAETDAEMDAGGREAVARERGSWAEGGTRSGIAGGDAQDLEHAVPLSTVSKPRHAMPIAPLCLCHPSCNPRSQTAACAWFAVSICQVLSILPCIRTFDYKCPL
ncbi:hypothetical protein H0H92_014840 [Tricholoma furcatifolium]|nr:hypothetical protein H0H92_014840 [Tricholoma furcatifolium]